MSDDLCVLMVMVMLMDACVRAFVRACRACVFSYNVQDKHKQQERATCVRVHRLLALRRRLVCVILSLRAVRRVVVVAVCGDALQNRDERARPSRVYNKYMYMNIHAVLRCAHNTTAHVSTRAALERIGKNQETLALLRRHLESFLWRV